MKRNLLVIFCAALLGGCGMADIPAVYTPVKKILDSPGQYQGQEVRVRGKVTDITKVPLVDLRYYTLQDDSGEIMVFPKAELPAVNETVTVKGKVDTSAVVAGKSFGLRIEEIDRSKLP